MKIQVADYVAQFLMEKGITDLFSVVGGGSMFLNDAFGRAKGIRCIYNHHEQACAMAAEAYFKYKNQMAAVCVTSGPGGTNALTGVLGAWQDSIPLFIISGQVRYETTVDSAGLSLRQFGGTGASNCGYCQKYNEVCGNGEKSGRRQMAFGKSV